MGYDLPAAIGAATAARASGKRRVVCFAGVTGSLQMNIQELQTLEDDRTERHPDRDEQRGLSFDLADARELLWPRDRRHSGERRRIPGFRRRGFGLRHPATERITTVADLHRLDELLQRDGPLLNIDLHGLIRARGFAPRIKSREDGKGGFITPELDDMFPFLGEDEMQAISRRGCEHSCATFCHLRSWRRSLAGAARFG